MGHPRSCGLMLGAMRRPGLKPAISLWSYSEAQKVSAASVNTCQRRFVLSHVSKARRGAPMVVRICAL
jgi:hypothetical protein